MKLHRGISVLLFVVAALLGALYLISGVPLRQAREAWLSGHEPAAIALLERWRVWKLRPREYDEALAAAHLTNGDPARARPYLARIAAGRSPRRPIFSKLQVAQRLVARGAYADFLQFDQVVRDLADRDDVALYRAAALAG